MIYNTNNSAGDIIGSIHFTRLIGAGYYYKAIVVFLLIEVNLPDLLLK